MKLLSLELKSAEGKCRPHRNSVPSSLGLSPAVPAEAQQCWQHSLEASCSAGISHSADSCLEGLATKARLPGIAGKIDSFSLKNCKNSGSAHIHLDVGEKSSTGRIVCFWLVLTVTLLYPCYWVVCMVSRCKAVAKDRVVVSVPGTLWSFCSGVLGRHPRYTHQSFTSLPGIRHCLL